MNTRRIAVAHNPRLFRRKESGDLLGRHFDVNRAIGIGEQRQAEGTVGDFNKGFAFKIDATAVEQDEMKIGFESSEFDLPTWQIFPKLFEFFKKRGWKIF